MAVNYGSKTVTDGLILYLDAGNPKSYNPNLVTTLGAFNYNFNGQSIGTQLDTAPDGSVVLCKHDFTGASGPFMSVRADRSLLAGTYTISAWFKGTTAFSANFALVGETVFEAPSQSINITTQWQRFSVTLTLANNQSLTRIQLFFSTQGNDKIVSVWGVELVRGSSSTPNYINLNNRGVDWNSVYNQANSITGLPDYSSGNGGSIVFDGVDDFVDTGQTYSFNQSDQFSVEFCINFISHADRPAAAAGIVGKGHYYNNGWDIWLYNDHRISFETSGDPTRQGLNYLLTSALSLNTWHHYVATYNNGLKSIYVNGVPAGTVTYTGPGNFTNTNNVLIGRRFGDASRSLRGNMSLVKIYNRQLSALEVQENFNAIRGRYRI